jgi:hypothetical protein
MLFYTLSLRLCASAGEGISSVSAFLTFVGVSKAWKFRAPGFPRLGNPSRWQQIVEFTTEGTEKRGRVGERGRTR